MAQGQEGVLQSGGAQSLWLVMEHKQGEQERVTGPSWVPLLQRRAPAFVPDLIVLFFTSRLGALNLNPPVHWARDTMPEPASHVRDGKSSGPAPIALEAFI